VLAVLWKIVDDVDVFSKHIFDNSVEIAEVFGVSASMPHVRNTGEILNKPWKKLSPFLSMHNGGC